jgi:hypothetical protein
LDAETGEKDAAKDKESDDTPTVPGVLRATEVDGHENGSHPCYAEQGTNEVKAGYSLLQGNSGGKINPGEKEYVH